MKSFLVTVHGLIILLTILSCKQDKIQKAIHGSNQKEVDRLIKKAKGYQNSNNDSLIVYAQQLQVIGNKSLNRSAVVYGAMFAAQVYWHAGNHKEAMITAMKGLEKAERYHVTEPIPMLYGLIANLHKENSNYKLAFNAQEKGFLEAERFKDTAAMIKLISNKAMFIHSFHLHDHTPQSQDSSISVHLKGLLLAESKAEYMLLRIPFYNNIAQYYKDQKQYHKAIEYANRAVSIATDRKQYRSLTYSYAWLGQSWYALHDQAKGFRYLNQGLQISQRLKQPYREMELLSDLYQMYYQSKDYKRALDLHIRGQEIHDSLQVQMNEKQISELQIRYESAQKDKQLLLLDSEHKKQNQKLLAVLAGALILLMLLLLLINRYRIIRVNNRMMQKSNADKTIALEHIAVIQAHDLRKPLSSILGLIHVIKEMGDEVDPDCLNNLEIAGRELDLAIHTVISTVEKAEARF
ncbi:hypothetical protein [Pedobacter duraquae]|uniref:Tetratricopeptide repeat protein n=1 Tax=Pedobacter duraquae TaxID=425511 RepID=A0A4R6IEL1_9SPHI|nr:hypothetical protein [Pedobacter duraquae]TDO20186.1 tetratricopeptide repeat protein [Pedobacter duraquae]